MNNPRGREAYRGIQQVGTYVFFIFSVPRQTTYVVGTPSDK